MAIESSLIISCGSLAITVGGIIYYAGALPEKLRTLSRLIDKLESANKDSIKQIEARFVSTVERIHSRFDDLQRKVVNSDGQTLFVTRNECIERNTHVTQRYAQNYDMFCKLINDLQADLKHAAEERNKQLDLLRSMSERLAKIEGKA